MRDPLTYARDLLGALILRLRGAPGRPNCAQEVEIEWPGALDPHAEARAVVPPVEQRERYRGPRKGKGR